ncbi:VanZ family protein [Enterococcus rivorum]|nr:VanZ family protein [Enterococcus rivorum]MBP2097598.1 VanZ family protein [Enterococcus rivorum]
MKKIFRNKDVYIGIAFLVMAILFYSSSQTYEQQSQVGVIQKLLSGEPFKEQLKNISFIYAGDEVSIQAKGYVKFVEFFIRKGAHFGTYFILGGSWFLGLLPRIKSVWLTGVIAWLAATGYAGLDEFHQMMTGGRTPLFQDVMLDSAGALTAVALCLLIIGIKKLRKK